MHPRYLIPRRWRRNYFNQILLLVLLANLFEVLYVRHRFSSSQPADRPLGTTKLYIASLHWNNEAILRSHWNKAVLDLVKVLGPTNVFLSIHESGSWDDSKGALRELRAELKKLKVWHNITLSEVTHLDEINAPPIGPGWIETPRGKTELRRIPYLSRLRNDSLWNLEQLYQDGYTFDKILFLNDVVFTVRVARSLACYGDS
jgi:hypothetical protein